MQAGTLTTAWVAFLLRYASALSFISASTTALISWGVCGKKFVSIHEIGTAATSTTYDFLEIMFALDLDGRLSALVDDFERPAFLISLDVCIIEIAQKVDISLLFRQRHHAFKDMLMLGIEDSV